MERCDPFHVFGSQKVFQKPFSEARQEGSGMPDPGKTAPSRSRLGLFEPLLKHVLRDWRQSVAIRQENEHLFNSSVCTADGGFVMAYDTDDPRYVPFSVKFARSADLRDWSKVPEAVFGKERYAACPCIRHADGHFYLMYTEHGTPRWFFETWMARSRDLKDWVMSPANPLLTPGPNEDINTSDPDVVEYRGKTYLYYSVGDQRSWAKLKRAVYPATLGEFFETCFEAR